MLLQIWYFVLIYFEDVSQNTSIKNKTCHEKWLDGNCFVLSGWLYYPVYWSKLGDNYQIVIRQCFGTDNDYQILIRQCFGMGWLLAILNRDPLGGVKWKSIKLTSLLDGVSKMEFIRHAILPVAGIFAIENKIFLQIRFPEINYIFCLYLNSLLVGVKIAPKLT